MEYFLCAGMALGCFALARWALDIDRVEGCSLTRAREPLERTKKLAPAQMWWIAGGLGLCGGATMWRILERAQDGATAVALAIALLCLLGGACVDALEHRIPNLFPGVLALGAVVLLVWSMAVRRPGAMGYVVSALFSCAGCALALLAASALSGGGIGPGDIKLVSALGLMCGVEVICRTLIFGMTACAATACVLLATKRKTRKDTLPFGPFLLVGYVAGLWITLI